MMPGVEIYDRPSEIILKSWLELFIMIMTNKNIFKFGQLTMNIEVFEIADFDKSIINFVDVNDIKWDLLAKIGSKKDLDVFLETFEAKPDNFILLSDYESIENITFTGEAKELILTAINRSRIWINSEWSDNIILAGDT